MNLAGKYELVHLFLARLWRCLFTTAETLTLGVPNITSHVTLSGV
jgi:hypothetical protein